VNRPDCPRKIEIETGIVRTDQSRHREPGQAQAVSEASFFHLGQGRSQLRKITIIIVFSFVVYFYGKLQARFVSMLSWDFVKADPVTYRGIDGTIRFEVKVETDNRKDAITVTRMEGDKFKIKIFPDHRKALRWCEKHPWRPESFFGLFRF
jgi:hypothetical protein